VKTTGLTERERTELKALAQRLRDEMGALEVRVFGSAVRGEMDDESDIDLFVVLPLGDREMRDRVTDLCFETSLEVDRLVAPFIATPAGLELPRMKGSPLMKALRKEGLPI